MDRYDFVDTFRNRFEKAMEFRGMTAADVCRKSGLSDALVSGYRTGRQEPKRERISILAKALNVSPTWLMGFNVPIIDINIQIPNEKEASERLNSYLNSLDDNKKILEMAHFEFSKKYLTNDSMEVLAAYHDADIVVKNVIRKVLDLPSLEEKKESSAS